MYMYSVKQVLICLRSRMKHVVNIIFINVNVNVIV